MRRLRRSGYSAVWDRYVSGAFPKVQAGVPHADRQLEEWRVLNTTDRAYEWPGDEWGDRDAALQILSDAVTSQLGGDAKHVCEIGAGAGRYTVLAFEQLPDVTILSFDVSKKFEAAMRSRFETLVQSGRLRLFRLGTNPSFFVKTIRQHGLLGKVDAVYSFDAMVHVDLHTLAVYCVSASRVLRPGGVLAMNVADACSDVGFVKLLHDARGAYARSGAAGGHFMWISREIVESMLDRLGFDVTFTPGNGRDLFFSAKLVDPERSSAWMERAGVRWLEA